MNRVASSSPSQIRWFGVVMLAVGLLVAFRMLRAGCSFIAAGSGACVGAVVCMLSLIAPQIVRPLYRAWMIFGQLLGRVTTPIVLTIVFAVVFVPAKLFMSLFRKDLLSRRFEPKAHTYWTDRPASRQTFTAADFERLV